MSKELSVSLFEHFSALPDPRGDRTKCHLLLDIIGLSICVVICGADGWEAIEEYGDSKYGAIQLDEDVLARMKG